jgi:hypothetical protein
MRRDFPDAAAQYQDRHRVMAEPAELEEIGRWLWVNGVSLTINEEFIILQRRPAADAVEASLRVEAPSKP